MKLSVPIYQLKRDAKRRAREEGIPLHTALDRVAEAEGYSGWSLLAARYAQSSPVAKLHGRLQAGELVLVGARPGQGKTLLALELAAEAAKAGGQSMFFTLEYTDKEVLERLRPIGASSSASGRSIRLPAISILPRSTSCSIRRSAPSASRTLPTLSARSTRSTRSSRRPRVLAPSP